MKLYVGNLPFSVNTEGLKKIFANYTVQEATLIQDKFSGRSKGFGFVTIEDDEEAKKAISEFNGKEFEGRELKVSEAKPMEDRPKRDFGNRGGFNKGSGRGSYGGRSRY
jgi:RNA recognition motif-containing protein